MKEWYNIFARHTGLSLYIWIIFCILPFYFIFRSTSVGEIIFGIAVTLLFFAVFWLTYSIRGPRIYIGLSLEFLINIVMTILYGYVYFALFIAFYVGSIRSRAGFISMYVIHLVMTVGGMSVGFFLNYSLFLSHLPFLIMTILGVILIPLNKRNRLQREALEGQLEDANQRIAELAIVEERHRIARDLHDTLGQKLSTIGLKSELSRKLMEKNDASAKNELDDIHNISRQALNEVRELISNMKDVSLNSELKRVAHILDTARIDRRVRMEADMENIPSLTENVLSMCLKEAVNNVVKHSNAERCKIRVAETKGEVMLKVTDNGSSDGGDINYGNGLEGMDERLSFVNGKLRTTRSKSAFEVHVTVPKILKEVEEG